MLQVNGLARRSSSLLSRIGLLLLTIATTAFVVRGEPGKVVTLFEYYPARQAAFGAEVPEWGWINLMLPPRNLSTLCQYPEIALEVNDTQKLPQNRVNVNLGMLVRTGNCSAEQQARNAVRLKYEGGVSMLRYLIVQGESNDDNMLGVLFPETNSTKELSSLVVLSTTYRAGEYLRDDISAYRESERPVKSPYLYDEASVDWDMVGNLDPYKFPTNSSSSDNFYWFRILLFTLLIVSPCIRAAYLWWAGGGRFRLRRNEQGRITGIQYVRPAPYWLSNGLIPGGRPTAPTTDVLTEEEFQALPEIAYKPRDDTEAQEDEIDVEAAAGAPSAPLETTSAEPVQPIAASINHIESSIPSSLSVSSAALTTVAAAAPVVAGDGAVDLGGALESTCTLCSICIDDFEEGEKLVLLPRCRHSFHRECIHPWLTERQGCCPLCKTSVLEKDESRTLENPELSSDSSSDSTSSSDNTRRIRNRDDPSTVALSTVGELDESEASGENPPPGGARRRNDEGQSGSARQG